MLSPLLSLPPRARFLVIRRDNIGDLVCTTPVFQALRDRFPDARIAALVNSYNAVVLKDHPCVDDIYVYTKGKHRGATSLLDVYVSRLRLIASLRRTRVDCAIIASAPYTPRAAAFARWIRARHVIAYTDAHPRRYIDYGIPYTRPRPMHEAEDVFRLLAPLGIEGAPPPLYVATDASRLAHLRTRIKSNAPCLGIHIGAREEENRWPLDRFTALARIAHERYGVQVLLFWTPGGPQDPLYPGDDARASGVIAQLTDVPIIPMPARDIADLIAGLSLCDHVVCCDSGAVHLAAAVRKPVMGLYCDKKKQRWYPWGVPSVVLSGHSVRDISLDQARAGLEKLLSMSAPVAPVGDRSFLR